ncbi:MAG: hypothetical protein IID43_01160 [Planctomycetes bacterium]|nr:hypothetical protein [Planctomycetota bacterium]
MLLSQCTDGTTILPNLLWNPAMLKRAFVGGMTLLLTFLIACERSERVPVSTGVDETGPSATETGAPESLSPIETVRYVHKLRLDGRLDQLESYVLEDQRTYVVELIHSVDRLIVANKVLQASVEKHLGPASAAAFDHSDTANILGVFSRDIEAIKEWVRGDEALVVIQVANRVPLEQVRLVRQNGRWVIQSDTPIPEVAAEVRKLADVLVRTARRLGRIPMTASELKRELALQQAPIGRRLARLTGSAP